MNEQQLEELVARLDVVVVDATDAELSALRRYQGRDRSYELINRFLRRELDPASLTEQQLLMVDEVVTALDSQLCLHHDRSGRRNPRVH